MPLDSRSEVFAAAARAAGVPDLGLLDTLVDGGRTEVWRVTDGERTMVLKRYRDPASNTWRREAAGLLAAQGAGSPEVVALVADPALLLMTDLGSGQSLADHLLGSDAAAADSALVGWARALGALHVHSTGRAGTFAAALGDDLPVSVVAGEVDRLPEQLGELCREHDLPGHPRLAEDLAVAAGSLADQERWVVTPGDTCPDNNLFTDGSCRLLDFEFAEVRHPAWDLAYLRVPWPTCWCAWQIPGRSADAAVAAYRSVARTGLPWVSDVGFERDVEQATLLWCLISSTMFLAGALGEPSDHREGVRRPGRRTMVLGRLELASRLDGPTELTAYAARLARELAGRWGAHPLAMAPAYDR